MDGNVLYVDITATEEKYAAGEAIMAAIEACATTNVTSDVQEGTLQQLY